MNKFLSILCVTLSTGLFSMEEDPLQKWVKEKISENEYAKCSAFQKNEIDVYYYFGKQNAYEEILQKLLELKDK